MRTIFYVIIITIIGAINANAQNSDSLQLKTSSISVDSLVMDLKTLKHNYDFLYCDYELHKVITSFSEFTNTTNITSNSILINYYNSRFERDLYSVYLKLYNAKTENLNTLKERARVARLAVLGKTLTSEFTKEEMGVIQRSFEFIDSQLSVAEQALSYLEVVLDTYRTAK